MNPLCKEYIAVVIEIPRKSITLKPLIPDYVPEIPERLFAR